MDRKTKDAIESFVWGVTVGAGLEADDISNEPDGDVIRALEFTLGHKLTHEEESELVKQWQSHIMQIAFP